MPRYVYHCINCNNSWEEDRETDYRNAPCVMPCPHCGEYYVNRVLAAPAFKVPRGKCGNADNNYTSTKGD